MNSRFEARAVRFEAISKKLAESHKVAPVHHTQLVRRLLMAFRPAPKLRPRGRPPLGEERKKRDDSNYRHCRARDGYLAALDHGSCFFLAYIISFGKMDSKVSTVKSLLQRNSMAAKYRFSPDVDTRNDIMAWAREGHYSEDKDFVKFFEGLPSLQVSTHSSRAHEIPLSTPVVDQSAQIMRDKGLGTNHQVPEVISKLLHEHAGGEEQQKEAGTKTIGRLEEAGTQFEAEDPRIQKIGIKDKEDMGTQTEAEYSKDVGTQTEAEHPKDVGTQTEAGDPEDAAR